MQCVRHIRLGHKLVYLIGAVEDGVNEVSLLPLLFQHRVHHVGEAQAVFVSSVIYREIVAAPADLMITFSALPVGVQPVPPGNDVVPFRDGAGGGFQTGQGFLFQLAFELLFSGGLRHSSLSLFVLF